MKKQLQYIRNTLKQGIDPHHLALTCILPVLIGLIPVWGVSSLLLTFLALRFKLNLVLIQLLSWLMTPLQLVAMYFFFQKGNEMMGEQAKPIDFAMLQAIWQTGWLHTLHFIYQMHVYAFLLWLVSASIAGLLFYPILKFIFIQLKKP